MDSSPLVAKAVIEAPMSHAIMMGLKRLLVGQDPFETLYLWHAMHDKTLYYGRAGAVIQTIEIKGGYAEVPMEPGLGIEPDPAMIEKYAYR